MSADGGWVNYFYTPLKNLMIRPFDFYLHVFLLLPCSKKSQITGLGFSGILKEENIFTN